MDSQRWVATVAAAAVLVPSLGSVAVPLALIGSGAALGAVNAAQSQPCGAAGNPLAGAVSLAAAGNFTAEQRSIAATAVKVANARHLPPRAQIVILAAGFQESGVRNLPYGDRDSMGWLQQRATWGSPAERMNPGTAAGRFFDHLVRISGWASLPVTVAAQKAQVSGYPNAYAKWERAAVQLVASVTGHIPPAATTTSISTTTTPSCSPGTTTAPGSAGPPPAVGGYRTVSGVRIPVPKGPTGVAINYALSQVGKPYVWAAHGPNAFDCSGLTSAAWKTAGVSVFPQSEVQDQTLPHVPLGQARPGDILWHPGHVQIFLGVINGKSTVVEAANPRAGIRVDTSGWMHPKAVLRVPTA